MNRMNQLLLSFIIILVLVVSQSPTAWTLDKEFIKNGEVYILLNSVGPTKPNLPGIYKLSEYAESASGKRDIIVASKSQIPDVYVTAGSWVETFGIAVNKDRSCYTFAEKTADNYVSAPVGTLTVAREVAVFRSPGSGKSGWYAGGCSGTPSDYFNGGCGASHTAAGHQTGHIVWWRGGGVGDNKFKCSSTFAPAMTFNDAGDTVTSIGGTYTVFPCSMAYEGWSGDPWPEPVGATTTRTIKGVSRKISNSNTYVMPSGMWFHDATDRSHRYFNGAGMMLMYSAAVKYKNLYMHYWEPTSPYKSWKTGGVQVQNYKHTPGTDIIFQLFDAKFHIFRATPCGDGCMPGQAAKQVKTAGNSRISITITPFGRSYGLQVINDTSVKFVSIKRVDPKLVGNKIVGTLPTIEYKPGDKLTGRADGKDLNLVTIGTVGSNWLNARTIATSYKFSTSENPADFNTKKEYVYLSDKDLFAVADTWFGDGGRTYSGTRSGDKINVEAQNRNEETSTVTKKFFQIKGKIKDFASDGYGNFYYLTTTDFDEIQKVLNDTMKSSPGDFTKLKTEITKPDKWGFPLGYDYSESGWKTDGGVTLNKVAFKVNVYKTVYKLGLEVISQNASLSGTGPNLSDSTELMVAGRIKIGVANAFRYAERKGAVVTWFSDLQDVEGIDWENKNAEISTINIAAPPEVGGENYYVDIKGNTVTNKDELVGDAAKVTDTIAAGEEGNWRIENPSKFDIYGMNEVTGAGNDENGNGIVGGMRNNIIEKSLAYHWQVYRLYDISEMAMPPYTYSAGNIAGYNPATTGGKYKQNLIHDQWQMYSDTSRRKDVMKYLRTDGKKNSDFAAGKPVLQVNDVFDGNGKPVTGPWQLLDSAGTPYKFTEPGIYKIYLGIRFDYYDYASMKFGENKGALDSTPGYKKSCWDLPTTPAGFPPAGFDPAMYPHFKQFDNIRYVVVTTRDSSPDSPYIAKVSVGTMSGDTYSIGGEIATDEIDRYSLLLREVGKQCSTGSKFDESKLSSLDEDKARDDAVNSSATQTYVDSKRMLSNDIAGEFAIKFIGAFPDRTKASMTEKEAIIRYGGVGVFDYNMDRKAGYVDGSKSDPFDDFGGTNPLRVKSNTNHPPNAPGGSLQTADFTLVNRKVKDTQIYRHRNFGLHGFGTLARSVTKDSLDILQKGMDPKDPFYIDYSKLTKVQSSLWNGNKPGEFFPIREIDWDVVEYQWTIGYEIDGKVQYERPQAFHGTVREIMQWAKYHDKTASKTRGYGGRAFIKNLTQSLPAGVSNVSSIFGDGFDYDAEGIPAYHVRIPMLEKIFAGGGTSGVCIGFKPLRWETPIGPRKYHIGLEVKAPFLSWRKHDSGDIDSTITDPDGGPSKVVPRQVFWDIVPGTLDGSSFTTAYCGPHTSNQSDTATAETIKSGIGTISGGLPHAKVFVNDLEKPHLSILAISSSATSLTFTEATTGDKYHKPLDFVFVDNNPNFNPLIYTENTSKMHFEFPDWNNEKMKVQEDSVGKSYAVQPCTFGPSEHSLGDEGSDAFYFIPSSSAECFGAPYSIFTNQLPVRAAADPDKLFMRSGTERGNSTPYMAPNHVGDMYYDMEFTVTTAKGSETMGGNIDIPGYGAKDIKKELYSKLFKFSITDNDPPQIAVESQTSFTEKKQFNISFTDIPFVHGNFNSPGVFESAFDTALKSADPTGWPAGIVDSAPTVVTSGTSEAYFGPGLLSVDTNAESRKVPNATEATGDLRTASVTLIRGRDPKYMVYIPENSRAVFRIQACDNVPVSKGNYQMKIDWSNNGNFTSEVEAINGGAKTDAMNKFLEDIAIAIDPKDPNIVNLYGTFRTPMKAGEEGALKLVVTDAAGNSREIDVPFQVVDTFIKKDRLDLERQRTNQ